MQNANTIIFIFFCIELDHLLSLIVMEMAFYREGTKHTMNGEKIIQIVKEI